MRRVRVSWCLRATPTTARETFLPGPSVCSRLRHPTVKTGSRRRSVLSQMCRISCLCAKISKLDEHACKYSLVMEIAVKLLGFHSFFVFVFFLKEFHEISFLKKFKFKRQDRVFPKEPPAASAAAPASSSAASASGSAAPGSSSVPTELPTELPTGQSLTCEGLCPPSKKQTNKYAVYGGLKNASGGHKP